MPTTETTADAGAGEGATINVAATPQTAATAEPANRRRPGSRDTGGPRRFLGPGTIFAIMVLLFAVPWWTLIFGGAGWPLPVRIIGTLLFAAAFGSFPYLMRYGHGRRLDWAARIADTMLGVVWVLFTWSVLGNVLRLALQIAAVDSPERGRITAAAVAAISLVLLCWGYAEAMRTPRVKRIDITLDRLAKDLDGLRVVLLTDTHYGPINRVRWSNNVIDQVNALDADVLCHTGDIADGTVTQRLAQAEPLGRAQARMVRAYVTGNHEYFGEAQGWLDHMAALGWEPLHNRHVIVRRGEARLVIAGVDDRTAAGSGLAGHSADHAAALAGADPDLPVLLLAHQPRQIDGAVAHGIDLQISGHTHGGQIWPFHFLVRTDQPTVAGLSRHGARTQLYTSRGTGFWGPPFRVFAPSEITLLTLRSA